MVVGPIVNNTNSKNRRSHNTAGPINSLSKVLHVLEPPENTTLYHIYKGPAPSRVNYKTAKPPGQSWVPAALPFPPTCRARAPDPSHSIGWVVEMALEQGEISPLSLLCEHRPVRPKKNSAC